MNEILAFILKIATTYTMFYKYFIFKYYYKTYLDCTSTSWNNFFNFSVRCCFGSTDSSPVILLVAGQVATQEPHSITRYDTNV